MQRPNLIKFPLKITEDRDLDGHARVADPNNAFVFRLVAAISRCSTRSCAS